MPYISHRKQQAGFTLVEIAIVLVIIGLLLGGILKGQEMIVQAKIKSTISDFNGVLAAYNGYIDRYRKLPGDDNEADPRWGTVPEGNGNAVIEGEYNSTAANAESRLFWSHLRLSGFIPGAGTDQTQPQNSHNGILGVQTGTGTLTAGSGVGTVLGGFGSVIICASQVPDKVAIAVDNQTDDGRSNTGQVRAVQNSGNAQVTGASSPANYTETGSQVYVICRQI